MSSYRPLKAIPLGDGLAVGLRSLESATQVRILVPQPWSHRLAVRTLASHAGNRGSIPRGTTINNGRLGKKPTSFFILTMGVNVRESFPGLEIKLFRDKSPANRRLSFSVPYSDEFCFLASGRNLSIFAFSFRLSTYFFISSLAFICFRYWASFSLISL